mmetsp:Transcript_39538/g.39105  ORF Transcript_39538/g.39105 Transcript_39538/m.39105 type:complete len:192 (+) Transcript_39538:315-890(+)
MNTKEPLPLILRDQGKDIARNQAVVLMRECRNISRLLNKRANIKKDLINHDISDLATAKSMPKRSNERSLEPKNSKSITLEGNPMSPDYCSGNVTNSDYREELVKKVDTMYDSIYDNRSGKRFISWYKSQNKGGFPKFMPRPSSVAPTESMNAFRDLKKMREFARKKQERCIKDLSTFEHYIKGKLKPRDV